MVKSGKIFMIPSIPLEEAKDKLERWEKTVEYEDAGFKVNLIEDISKLSLSTDQLQGIYSYDHVLQNIYRGRLVHTPVTQSSKFVIGDKWLIVMASKMIANRIAVNLAEILNLDVREATIWSNKIDGYLKANDQAKVVFFDNLDIPGVNKNTLYGEQLVQTNLFGDFKDHGDFRYVITKSTLKGWTVGIVNDGAIVLFNNVEDDEYVDFIEEEIMDLVDL